MIDHEQLRDQRFVYIPAKVNDNLLRMTMSAFTTLVRYTPYEILHLTQRKKPEENSTPLGYTRRDGVGKNPDIKHYLHVSKDWLADHSIASLAREHGQLKFFMACAQKLLLALTPTAKWVIREFHQQYPECGFERYFLDEGEPFLELRFLAYDKLPKGHNPILGRAHTDKSGFTFGVYESRPGLEVTGSDGMQRSVPAKKNHFSLIAGRALATLTNGLVQPSHHQVVEYGGPLRHPPTKLCAGLSREGLICFVDTRLHALRIPDKEETHTFVE